VEFKTASGLIQTGEVLCESGADLLLEGEHAVPDYQSEIFRIIRTDVRPVLLQKAVVGQRVSIEGYGEVTVSYQGAEEARLCTAAFKLPFSRQFDLAAPAPPVTDVQCALTVQYFSCSAVSPRRLQARGTLAVQLQVLGYGQRETVCSISGAGAQQLTEQKTCFYKAAAQQHRFTLDETLELELGGAASPVLLRADASVRLQTPQYDAGRVAVNGSVLLSITADAADGGENALQHSGYEIPFYQLLPMELPEGDVQLFCTGSCSSVSVQLRGEQGVADAVIGCTLELSAYRSSTAELVLDAFSTEYEAAVQTLSLPLVTALVPFEQELAMQAQFAAEQGAELVDYGVAQLAVSPASQDVPAQVNGEFFAIFRMADGALLSQQASASLPLTDGEEGMQPLQVNVSARQCELAGQGGQVRISLQGQLQGLFARRETVQAVCGMQADAERRKPKAAVPLMVCYTQQGESVWQLAKRLGTSADAIAAENALLQNDAGDSGLLLIPMV